MAYQDLVRADGATVQPSASETRRFGVSVGRLQVGDAATVSAQEVAAAVLAQQYDVVVLRYPSRRVDWAAHLLAAGLRVLPADTLLYYRLAAEDFRDDEGLATRVATTEPDRAQAARILRESFAEYPNHYAANPLFPAEAALEGYVEWAMTSTAPGGGSDLLLHLDEQGEALGTTTGQRGASAEIPLVAVQPALAGKGVYRRVLPGIERHLFERGAREVLMSTQSHNIAVLRTWTRRGWQLVGSYLTLHVSRSR